MTPAQRKSKRKKVKQAGSNSQTMFHKKAKTKGSPTGEYRQRRLRTILYLPNTLHNMNRVSLVIQIAVNYQNQCQTKWLTSRAI